MSRAGWRAKGKRSRRRANKALIEQTCLLHVDGFSIEVIGKITGLPEELVTSILASVDRCLAESVVKGGGGYE